MPIVLLKSVERERKQARDAIKQLEDALQAAISREKLLEANIQTLEDEFSITTQQCNQKVLELEESNSLLEQRITGLLQDCREADLETAKVRQTTEKADEVAAILQERWQEERQIDTRVFGVTIAILWLDATNNQQLAARLRDELEAEQHTNSNLRTDNLNLNKKLRAKEEELTLSNNARLKDGLEHLQQVEVLQRSASERQQTTETLGDQHQQKIEELEQVLVESQGGMAIWKEQHDIVETELAVVKAQAENLEMDLQDARDLLSAFHLRSEEHTWTGRSEGTQELEWAITLKDNHIETLRGELQQCRRELGEARQRIAAMVAASSRQSTYGPTRKR